MSKEPLFVSIVCEDERFNKLSGQYNFDSIENKAAVYVRDGGPHPCCLFYSGRKWYFGAADSETFRIIKSGIKLRTQGLY